MIAERAKEGWVKQASIPKAPLTIGATRHDWAVATPVAHQFFVEQVGPLRHGMGGKAADTRFRNVCLCGFATPWRRYSGSLEEDRHEHLQAHEAAGERVSWAVRAAKQR